MNRRKNRNQKRRHIITSGKSNQKKTNIQKTFIIVFGNNCKTDKRKTDEITLSDINEMYASIHLKDKTPNTKRYHDIVWNHLSEYGDLKLSSIDFEIANSIISEMPDGKIRLSAYMLLKELLNKAYEWGYCSNQNPFSKIAPPKYKPKEKKILNENDIAIINKTIINEPLRYQCIFHLASMLGLRRQEIAALQWKDVDFGKKEIYINKAATFSYGECEDKTILKTTKTESSKRRLFIPDILSDKLKELKSENENDFIFRQKNGKMISLSTISNWWREYASKVGITKGVTFHGLRHSAASFMIYKGIDIATVSRTLGHSKISTTLNIYTHAMEDNKSRAISAAAEMFE